MIVADEIAHQGVEDVVVDFRHGYTFRKYSYEKAIAADGAVVLCSRLEGIAVIKAIKFMSVPVSDQEVSLKFFTEKLGFKVATDQPFDGKQRWIELLIPGAETGLVLFTPEGHEDRIGGFQPISFASDDVFATAAGMKAKGVEFAQEAKREAWGTSAIFKDPDGNQYVLSSR
jgi:catechol 2,3-dioxygenase-like lactoylglutathione lyase family enzyme